MNNVSDLTISEIEKLEGIKYELSKDITKYSLPKWYDSIRSKKVNDLNINDLAIVVRQEIFLIYIVPEVLKRLSIDPAIGDQYYGEVLAALYKTNEMFWKTNDVY